MTVKLSVLFMSVMPATCTSLLTIFYKMKRTAQMLFRIFSSSSGLTDTYLDNDQDYRLTYESKGKTDIVGSVDNVTLVNGSLSSVVAIEGRGGNKFRRNRVDFRSGKEYDNHKKKMRVWFKNNGKTNVVLDDIQIVKR